MLVVRCLVLVFGCLVMVFGCLVIVLVFREDGRAPAACLRVP